MGKMWKCELCGVNIDNDSVSKFKHIRTCVVRRDLDKYSGGGYQPIDNGKKEIAPPKRP